MTKTIRLQQREYTGSDGITKYKQHRINIPDGIIKRMEWDENNQVTISIESRNGKKRIILKNIE